MTAINNSINNIVHIAAKNTILSSSIADQISTKFSANIASVRNTPSSLNRHGNTFQWMITSSPATRPGAIKPIHSTAGSAIDKTSVIPRNSEDSYNQANGYATLSDKFTTLAECELDEYLFESYPLFGDTPKDSPNESSAYTGELKIPNTPFNPLNYTLTYMQPDEVGQTKP